MSDILEGNYFCKITQKDVEFLTNLGCQHEEAGSYLGQTWKFSTKKTGSGYVVVSSSDENPSINRIDTFQHGKEQYMDNPMFGGSGKIVVTRLADNKLLNKFESEQFGSLEYAETYSEDGIVMEYVKPVSFKQCWSRKFNENGWFKFSKGDNLKRYMEAQGLPGDVWEQEFEAWMKVEQNGSNFVLTEVWQNVSNVVRYKLDTEAEYSWPGMPKLDRKFVSTKIGNGKYRSTMVGKNGEKEEWELQFTREGLFYTGLDRNSGEKCTFYYNSFPNIFGKFRMVVQDNVQGYKEALGMTPEMASKLLEEAPNVIMTISRADDGHVNVTYDSQLLPVDVTFQLGKEFDFEVSGMPEKIMFLNTIDGDTLTYTGKSSKYATISTLKFTENFLIESNRIVGTDITSKVIMERL